jgi:glycosyltransferase involved in cell wall biosynthesis
VLLIVGDGPYRDQIEPRVTALSLADRVHLLGDRPDVPDLLNAMDVFALPSYANEGVPQAILQAMAMELPVVSTQVGAIDEAVSEGITGYLANPRDSAALANRLAQLLEDAALRASMGAAARSQVERRNSLAEMLDRMERVFCGIARLK